ncbi:MAG: hypothetical protein RQ743_06855 [Bacteroidales bacterium]|nr:hypothetical protein [Bacteroidales bacterium]
MKRMILILISVFLLSPVFGQKDVFKGFWWVEIKHGEPHLYFNTEKDRGGWNYGNSFDLDMFDGYMTGNNVTFYLRSEAGVIEFTGDITEQSGNGTYEWTPNKSYISEMGKFGYDDFSDKEYLIFALKNFRIKTLEEIISLGYDNIPSDKLVAIVALGIRPEYIRDIHKAGYDKIKIQQVISFKALGITPGYIENLRKAGIGEIDADDLTALKSQGVDIDFINECREMGFKDLDSGDLIKLKVFDLDKSCIDMIRQAGYKDARLEQILQFRIMDIDEEFIKKATQFNDGVLPDPDSLIQLKAAKK